MEYTAFTIITLAIISSIAAFGNSAYVEQPWTKEDVDNHKNSEYYF